MATFTTLLISGVVSGAIYAIMASGLVLTYTTSGVFNFAYGSIAFTVAFLFYELTEGAHWPVAAAAVFSILIFAPALGLLLDRVIFRGLARAGITAQIMGVVGLLIALPAFSEWLVERLDSFLHWTLPLGNQVQFPRGLGPDPAKNWTLLKGVTVSSDQLIILGTAAVVTVVLWWLVRRTGLGLRMRATVDRRDLTAMRGTDPDKVSRLSWAIGIVLAGLTGVIAAPILQLNSTSFTLLMFVAATASVLGGLRSIPLAFAGGIAIGIVQNLVAGYANFESNISGLQTSTPFILLILALFFVKKERGRRTSLVAEDYVPYDYRSDLPLWRQRAPWVAATGALVIVIFVASQFWVGLLTQGLALGLIFLSIIVVTGIGGMVSLAQAAFATTGALMTGLLLSHHIPFIPAVIIAAAVAGIVGLIVAVPALRLGGLSFALATLALGLLGDELLFPLNVFNNNQQGWLISPPVLGPINLANGRTFAIVLLVCVGIGCWVIRNLQKSLSGRAMVANRSSEAAATTIGMSPVRTKLALFGVSAVFAGIGGALLATFNGTASAADLPTTTGLIWLAIVVIFGVRRPGGAIVAGIVFALSPQLLSYITTSSLLPQILFGMGAIGLARNPDGALSDIAGARYRRRARRRDAEVAALDDGQSEEIVDLRFAGAAGLSKDELHLGADVGTVVSQKGNGSSPILQLQGLSAGYGEVRVIHDLSLEVAAGSIVGLLGPNGAGKSTLCSALAGLIPTRAGQIILDGSDITQSRSSSRSRLGLVVAPETRGIFPSLSVQENLAMWLANGDQREAVFERFPVLFQRRRTNAGVLSGGEQQMLALAPLLVRPPKVLIADEPSLGLAPKLVDVVFGLFAELREQGVGLLLIEEKAGAVREIADSAAILQLGSITWQGSPSDLHGTELGAAYLGNARPSREVVDIWAERSAQELRTTATEGG